MVEAKKKLRSILDQADQQRSNDGPRISWKTGYPQWAAAAGAGIKPTVLKRYKVSIRAVRTVLDPLYFDEITRRTVAEIVAMRRKAGATNATIRRDLTALSSVLRFAVAEGWIDVNAAKEWDRSVIRERRDPIVLPDTADIDAVVAACPGNLANIVRLAQFTGMRQEEIASLERRQVKAHEGYVELRKSKTDRPRVVLLDERAAGTLAGTPAHLTSQWVFWHGTDPEKISRYANVSSRFAAIVRRVGAEKKAKGEQFRPFRFHDLRHWFAVDYLRRHGGGGDLRPAEDPRPQFHQDDRNLSRLPRTRGTNHDHIGTKAGTVATVSRACRRADMGLKAAEMAEGMGFEPTIRLYTV